LERCGDAEGDGTSLHRILRKAGLPSPTPPGLFLTDPATHFIAHWEPVASLTSGVVDFS
jgi:hypothetical protein